MQAPLLSDAELGGSTQDASHSNRKSVLAVSVAVGLLAALLLLGRAALSSLPSASVRSDKVISAPAEDSAISVESAGIANSLVD